MDMNSRPVLYHKPGDKITILASNIEATIQKVVIDIEVVYYECTWWVESNPYTMNFYQSEIEKVTTV